MTRIAFLVPTRGAESRLPNTMRSVLAASELLASVEDVTVEVVVICGGQHQGLSCAGQKASSGRFAVIHPFASSKVTLLHMGCKVVSDIDFLFTVDDDVSFQPDVCIRALRSLMADPDLGVVAVATAVEPYSGPNPISRLVYDVINCRSLWDLYKDDDPYLIGRLVALRGGQYPVPTDRIVDDLSLDIMFLGYSSIIEGPVRYQGVGSLRRQFKRVAMLEGARRQAAELEPRKYDLLKQTRTREISEQRVASLNRYQRTCLATYGVLRFCTNRVWCDWLGQFSSQTTW